MMTLTKIKIINWMFINEETIHVKDNAVLIGQNGSGKTSIIDAIQYVLTGSKGQVKFNSAQGESKRTLLSYVRGNVGSREIEYLRPNDTISYLAIQVEDNEKKHVFGVALEYKETLQEKRFYIENEDINDEWFSDGESYKSYFDFRKQFGEKFIFFDTVKGYQDKIRSVLGLNRDTNYFNLLTKAIELRSIHDVNNFIKEFLLEKEDIKIDDLQQVLNNLNRVQKTIERNKSKHEELKKILFLGEDIKEKKEEYQYQKDKVNYSSYEKERRNVEDFERIIRQLRDKKTEHQNSIDIKYESLKNNEEILYGLQRDLNRNYPNIEEKKAKLKQLDESIKLTKNKVNDIDQLIKEDIINLKNVYPEIKTKLEVFYKQRFTFNENDIETSIKTIQQLVSKEMNSLDISYYLNETELSHKKKIQNELEQAIKDLNKGIPDYDDHVKNLIKVLKKELQETYQLEVEVKPICEYLEITNKEWQDAIEGYLNKNRFNLIVMPKYFIPALRIYHNHRHEIYGVTIIDTSKINHVEVRKDSLSEFIIGNNQYAQNYIHEFLNKVTYVGDKDELNKHQTAITKECMLYQRNGVVKINPNFYKTPYIGKEAILKQLKLKKEELQKINEEVIALEKENGRIKGLKEQLKKINLNSITFNEIRHYALFTPMKKEYDQLYDIYELLQKDSHYIDITVKMRTYETEIDLLRNMIIKLEGYLEANAEKVKEEQEKQKYSIAERDRLKESIKVISEIVILKIKTELKNEKINQTYIKLLDDSIKDLKYEIRNLEENLTKAMFDFNSNYRANYLTEYNNLPKYKQEFDAIDDKQFALGSELIKMKSQFNNLVMKNFISQVNYHINQIEQIIESINDRLKDKIFGSADRYKIVYQASKTDALNTLYSIAKKNDVESRTIFNQDEHDKDLALIEHILNQYFESEYLKIEELLDVRNYLEFDVTVRSNQITKSLKEVLGTQSGGEKQVPFYILIAAAFEQTKDPRRENLCVVLFDEAFSNMDPQRISVLLEFYSKLSIQSIISVPGKLESLANYVTTSLVVVKEGDNTTHVIEYKRTK